ncbi:MAG: pilus assembly PilX N-terminal domain-containing protein [Gemmatimonadaceae bacterium]
MFTPSRTTQQRHAPAKRPRRGIALVFVLIFVIAMAALAMSSIFMASNANLLAKSYDRERDLKFAAEAALSIGKSRVNADPSILTMRSVGQVDTLILNHLTLTGANGQPLTGVYVNVYVGPTGSTSGQFGRFSSIIAEARDQRGNGFIRRLELTQESFAKFAYWSNSESNGSTTIFFNNNDELWGPVWSNDTISIGSGRAIFHDEVGTAAFIAGRSNGTYSKGYKEYQKVIPLPSTATLATLGTIAASSTVSGASSTWDLPAQGGNSQNENSVLNRIEFVAMDLNNSGDSTDLNEGAFRYFTARGGLENELRGDWPTANNPSDLNDLTQCGDWHWVRTPGTAGGSAANTTQMFFPGSVHSQAWFKTLDSTGYRDRNPGWVGAAGNTAANNAANADKNASVKTVMSSSNAQCYLAGDPHLVAVERSNAYTDPATGSPYSLAAIRKGGTDTTFTPVGVNGSWRLWSNTPDSVFKRKRGYPGAGAPNGAVGDAKYLFPIDRLFNPNAKGVIRVQGNVGVSGTLNGRITLYSNGSIILLDDLRYANDPVTGVCRDILGLIADKDIVIADNAPNTPQNLQDPGGNTYRTVDDTKDMYIHGVMMALQTSFRVQNYGSGTNNANDCDVTNNGRGCIYLSGGLIQQARGAVGLSSGQGFAKRYSYDHCAVVNPPPYFPTTGRFQDNRYLELDPAGFNHTQYFKSITPDP